MTSRLSLVLLLSSIFLFSTASFGQRLAYVDVQKLLNSQDDYLEAQKELDGLAQRWRQEIAQQYDAIKSLYNKYQAEQVLLSDDARKQREDEIMSRETEVRDLQKQRFGPEGDLFKRRQELVQPIQDRIFRAIEEYASERGYDFIFDKSSSAAMIFSNPEYDKTEDILNKLK
jgi:outer membrane protein